MMPEHLIMSQTSEYNEQWPLVVVGAIVVAHNEWLLTLSA